MKKNKVLKAAIYVIVIVFVWIAALYVCISLKKEAALDQEELERISQTAGTYTYEDTILGIPVARTAVTVTESGIMEFDNENYPMLQVFPLLITIVFLVIVGLVTALVRRAGRKLEI